MAVVPAHNQLVEIESKQAVTCVHWHGGMVEGLRGGGLDVWRDIGWRMRVEG